MYRIAERLVGILNAHEFIDPNFGPNPVDLFGRAVAQVAETGVDIHVDEIKEVARFVYEAGRHIPYKVLADQIVSELSVTG